MPDSFKETLHLAQLARRLNLAMQTTAYTPQVLRRLELQEIDHLQMVCEVLNGSVA